MRNIAEYIARERVLELAAETPADAIRELFQPLAQSPLLAVPADFLEAVLQREEEDSTGLGMGVAIPHARPVGLSDLCLCVGRSRVGIDFLAPDNARVHFVFLIAAPVRPPALYLQVVARISWLMRNNSLRQQLYQTSDVDELAEILMAH
ncbi:MAG TPA: hypothetical protein DCR55_03515 [Lentisphaeria bacterium]|nr:hypothetical protein [Lentisphaeria bacterium]